MHKTSKTAHKRELEFMKAQKQYETAKIEAEGAKQRLVTERAHEAKARAELQAIEKEVAGMRERKTVEAREREAKLELLRTQ